MRRVLTAVVSAAVLAFGMPLAASSAEPANTASLTGRAVDVSGRAVAGHRVELLRGTQVVGVDTTTLSGDWMFRSVVPGTYVVRTTVNGKVAGVRVTVRAGEALAGTLIVLPAAVAAPQFGAVAGVLGGASSAVVTATAAAIATATAAVQETEVLQGDVAAITTVLNSLSTAQRQTFAQALAAALRATPNLANQFATATQAQELLAVLDAIVEDPTVVPPLPSSSSPSGD